PPTFHRNPNGQDGNDDHRERYACDRGGFARAESLSAEPENDLEFLVHDQWYQTIRNAGWAIDRSRRNHDPWRVVNRAMIPARNRLHLHSKFWAGRDGCSPVSRSAPHGRSRAHHSRIAVSLRYVC